VRCCCGCKDLLGGYGGVVVRLSGNGMFVLSYLICGCGRTKPNLTLPFLHQLLVVIRTLLVRRFQECSCS